MKCIYKYLFVVLISVSAFCSVYAQITQPNAPSNLNANSLSSFVIKLTWNDNSDNEDGFEIYRRTYSDSLFSILALVESNVTFFTDPDLESGTDYCYCIRAFNHAWYSDYTPAVCAATHPPSLIDVRLTDPAKWGEDINLSIIPDTGSQYTVYRIYYRISGKSSYSQSDLTSSGNLFSAFIPASYCTMCGIQYYVILSDGTDTLTYPSYDPVNSPATIQVNISALSYPMEMVPAAYRMVSVPLEISDSKLSSVLEDDYNSYNTSYWRLFNWDPEFNNYREYPDINSDIEPGKAYWLITKEGESFDIENAMSVKSDLPYTIELKPGYNQIGNPFAFPVAWSSIISSGRVKGPFSYNPDTNDWNNFSDSTILIPWEGYFVYNDSAKNIYLSIPPVESPADTLNKRNPYHKIVNEEFVLQIKAKIEFTKIQDYQNYVGMKVKAKDGYDRSDIYELPPIAQDLKLSIIDGDREYAQNIVPISSDGASWDLKINTQRGDRNVILNFDEIVQMPEKFKIWLADIGKNEWIPVIDNNACVVMSGTEKHLKMIAGTQQYAEDIFENIPLIPAGYHLSQNYPNPFNPVTHIRFGIPERTRIQLEVYDVLGRMVKSLLDNNIQNPGWYEISFDAGSLASGVYFFVLKTKKYSEVRKMLLMK